MGKDFSEKEWLEKYPKCYEWHQKLMGRDAVKRAHAVVEEAKKKVGGGH